MHILHHCLAETGVAIVVLVRTNFERNHPSLTIQSLISGLPLLNALDKDDSTINYSHSYLNYVSKNSTTRNIDYPIGALSGRSVFGRNAIEANDNSL